MLRALFCCLLALTPLAAEPAFPIHSLKVEGLERLPEEGVLRVAGLALGQQATPADFEAAAKRLTDTGLFHAVHYRYRPSPQKGYEVTFEIMEFEERRPVRLSVPEIDEDKLWDAIEKRDRLIQRDMPGGETPIAYYAKALEATLAEMGRPERITWTMTADLNRNQMVLVFRPAVLPKVVEVRVEGATSVPPDALAKATRAPIVGTEYMEQTVRELLDLNVRPLFEERGRLKVQFARPALTKAPDGVIVSIAVAEGPAYQLGKAEIRCEGIPAEELRQAAAFKTGQLANWREVSVSVSNLQSALQRRGYLDAHSTIERSLDDASGRADLVIAIEKGPQFTFGELRMVGIPDGLAARLRRSWKLAPGAPMNMDSVHEYVRSVASDADIRKLGRSVARGLQFRPGTSVVDVTLKFGTERTAPQ